MEKAIQFIADQKARQAWMEFSRMLHDRSKSPSDLFAFSTSLNLSPVVPIQSTEIDKHSSTTQSNSKHETPLKDPSFFLSQPNYQKTGVQSLQEIGSMGSLPETGSTEKKDASLLAQNYQPLHQQKQLQDELNKIGPMESSSYVPRNAQQYNPP